MQANEVIEAFWNAINENINFIVVLIVITAGYMVRWINILPYWNKTLKIAIIGLVVSLIYILIEGVSASQWLVSYFVAFGFHSLILKKLIDEPLNIKK